MHFVLSRVSSVNLLSDRRKRKPYFFPLPHSSLKSSHLNSAFTSPSCWLYKICIPAQRGTDTWVVYIPHPWALSAVLWLPGQAALLCSVFNSEMTWSVFCTRETTWTTAAFLYSALAASWMWLLQHCLQGSTQMLLFLKENMAQPVFSTCPPPTALAQRTG